MTQLEATNTLPIPLDWPEYDWRPPRREDVPALYEMLLAADKADDTQTAGTLHDLQTQFDDPWSDPETDSIAALTRDGEMAALARTIMNPAPEEECRVYLLDQVHPEHRGSGLEEFVLSWAEARGRQRLAALPSTLPRLLRSFNQDTLRGRIERLERCDYRPVRYFYRMRRDVRQPIPDRRPPDGLALLTFGPELSRPVLDALNEAFRDHWGYEPVSDEDWQMFFLQRSSFRPDLTFVAMDGDEVAGLSFNTISPEENARHGIEEGWVAELAVRRPWRRRGVASALLCETMRAFKAEGLDYATLGVDTENPSGALGLYEGLGFVSVKRFIALEKRIV